jgi:putative DNA primase/helicase
MDMEAERLFAPIIDHDKDSAPGTAADGCSDVQNAYRFWKLAGDDMLFVTGIGWFSWNGICWEQDRHEPMRIGQRIGSEVAEEVRQRLDDYQSEADKTTRDTIHRDIEKLNRHIKHSESRIAIESAIKLAESFKPIRADCLDTNPWLMNCANGTLDLKTGQLRKPERSDYLTKSTAIEYNPDAKCPTWEKALLEIFEGKAHIIRFLQRVFGYCLTGCVHEQVFFVFFGEGANGKDVILGRIRKLMGEYAGEVAPGLLVESRNEQHPTGIYDLRGKRLGVSSETGEGKPLDETLTKQLTGSERLKARGMRQDFIEFSNETKIVLMTNHLPEIKGDDYAMWRRIRLIPFNRIFKENERDEQLGRRLDKTELPGILRWAIEGCMEWQLNGLAPPDEILQATAGYKSDQDVLREFFECECEFGHSKQATAKAIWSRWKAWCIDNDQNPNSQKWLAPRLQRKGCVKRRSSSGMLWERIELKQQTENVPYEP